MCCQKVLKGPFSPSLQPHTYQKRRKTRAVIRLAGRIYILELMLIIIFLLYYG